MIPCLKLLPRSLDSNSPCIPPPSEDMREPDRGIWCRPNIRHYLSRSVLATSSLDPIHASIRVRATLWHPSCKIPPLPSPTLDTYHLPTYHHIPFILSVPQFRHGRCKFLALCACVSCTSCFTPPYGRPPPCHPPALEARPQSPHHEYLPRSHQ